LDSTLTYYAACLFVLGLGLGCMMAVVMTAVQNSSTVREMGMTTSAVNLIRSVGATIGTAVFAVLIGSKITQELHDNLSETVFNAVSHSTGVLDDFYYAYQQVQQGIMGPDGIFFKIVEEGGAIFLSFANSVDYSFICGAFIILLMLVIGIFFKVQTPPEVEEGNTIYEVSNYEPENKE